MELEKENNIIKQTCKELGITQKELAERIGVSRVTINDWANNKTPIPQWGHNLIIYMTENIQLKEFKQTIRGLLDSERSLILSQVG